jgi:hypothetical protein
VYINQNKKKIKKSFFIPGTCEPNTTFHLLGFFPPTFPPIPLISPYLFP